MAETRKYGGLTLVEIEKLQGDGPEYIVHRLLGRRADTDQGLHGAAASELERLRNILPALIARAREADEERKRIEGMEDFAEKAIAASKREIEDWAGALSETRDEYIEARATGYFRGRRIASEQAKIHAHDFGERASAVDGCSAIVEGAIRSLSVSLGRGDGVLGVEPLKKP